MLEATRERLLHTLAPDDLVLDIGGWADPFERADWVIDLMPYETRGLYEREGWISPRPRGPERFTPETWIQRDLCAREPYPFEDDSLDFVICSQTLEDLRDPIWVCSEMERIGKAGYIEVPSRLEEQSWGVNGAECVGWPHHRWLIDVGERSIEFVFKPHSLHARREYQFPSGFWEGLSSEARTQTLWWEESFSYVERVIIDEHESDRYLSEFVTRQLPARHGLARRLRRGASRLLPRGGS